MEQMQRIWSDVLGADCGPDTTFFEAGGHSLAAFRILSRIEAEYGVQVEVFELFEDPTVAEFAELVTRSGSPDA
ncbi:phosphopantetheine-binding protein [Kribbella sp. NPDC006257]|uniref:phosphopantetheine-binding protein n=1 Tax=Kribbella sp. NPDC006257 TaxID=3156738 RepID=UPI0033B8FE96